MNNQVDSASQESQERGSHTVQSDYRVGQQTGKPVNHHTKQNSIKVPEDQVEGDADNDLIVESDFSEINQYGDDQDSNEEDDYEFGLPSQSVNGNETPRDIQFKLENYSDDGPRSGESSDLVVNLDPAREKELPSKKQSISNTPRQKEQQKIQQERKPLHSPSPRKEKKTTSNREGGQVETSPASICPSPVEPSRKPAQKMSAQPMPVSKTPASESPSKITAVKATEIPRQQPLQSQPGQSLGAAASAMTLGHPDSTLNALSQSPLQPQHSLAIPQTVAGRMSLKDKMKAEQGMTAEQIEMNRHLSHVSNEYRRSQLRNQRQQVMEQFIRAEKNLSVIQQLEERSSNDDDSQTAHSARHDDSDSQLFSESGQGNHAATLAKKNKNAFIIAKKNNALSLPMSNEKQREGTVKSRQRVLTKTDKKASRKEDDNKKMKKRLIFNTYNTNYPIIDLAAKNLGFKTVFKDHNLVPSPELKAAHRIAPGVYATIIPEEFDVVWFDTPIKEDTLQKIKPHQRVSQWPGIQIITNKSRLAKNLTLMKKAFPAEYNFFPMSYNLPNDLTDFKKALIHQRDVYIVKPSHDCQGRGIYLASSIDDYQEDSEGKPQVAQTYIDNPLLIDKLKFDLRLYVLLFGIQPLRIYLFDDGLARFATTPYESALRGDKKNLFMHLTNYAINKKNENYVQNENFDGGTGTTLDGRAPGRERNNSSNHGQNEQEEQPEEKKAHKRSLKQIYKLIEEMGRSTDKLKRDIKELVIKTLVTGQSHLHHIFKTNHPDDFENQMCFQILGFDVMIDSNLKPWLIEVNQSPSFATDSAFDFTLKKKLMEDTFQLLNLTPERRSQYMEQREKYYIERLMTANKGPKMSFEEKEQRRFEIDNKRDRDDRKLLRHSGFECIFPYKDDEHRIHQYNLFLSKSREIQEAFIHGKRNLMKDKSVYDLILESVQNQNRGAHTPQQIPDKFINKRDRPKSAIEKNIIGGIQNQKRPARKEEDQAVRKKKEIDFQRVNMLENIQSQKDEQKTKDKTQKKKIAREVKQKQMAANVLFDKDLSAQVDQLITAQHQREKEQKEKLNARLPQETETKPVLATEPTKESAKSTHQTSQVSNYQKILSANKDLKNPYTQIQRATVSQIETQPKASPWPSMLRKEDERSKTPLTQKVQQQPQSQIHKKTKSILRQESYIQQSEKVKTIEMQLPVNEKASTLPKRFQPLQISLWKEQKPSNPDNNKGSAQTPRLPSPKQNNYMSPRLKTEQAAQNENGTKSQVIRQRGASTMNLGARSQLNFANPKTDFSFRNDYISNNKDQGTKSAISITVSNPQSRDKTQPRDGNNTTKDRGAAHDRSGPRDATKEKTDKSTNSNVTAPGRDKSSNAHHRRDRSENGKDYQEYSIPPPVRAPTYNPKQQQKQLFLSKYVPSNQKHTLEPVKLTQVKEPEKAPSFNLKNLATSQKPLSGAQNYGGTRSSPPGISAIPGLRPVPASKAVSGLASGQKKRSNSLENLLDPNEEQTTGPIEQPNSAPFSTMQKPSLGKSMRQKAQSPRNLKKQLFGTSQPAEFNPNASDTQYKDIIDKIEEKDQKEVTKMKSDTKRKRSEQQHQKKTSSHKFIIEDQPGAQNPSDKNQRIISGIGNMIDIYDQDKKQQQSNIRPASFFEKVRLDTSTDLHSKSSQRQNETMVNKNSFESQSKTVDFYQQELQKLQRVDKMLKKESKKQKKSNEHAFFSPQKRRKEKIESPRFTNTQSSHLGGQSSTTANQLMQSTMSSKTNNDDLVVVSNEPEKSFQSQLNILKSSAETSPNRVTYPNQSSIMSPQKNFMNMNKQGVAKMSNQITDMKDAMMVNSPELPATKKDSATTPQRGGKLVKKIPNQNKARDQFIQLIEVLKGEEKDPIFELDHDFKINQVIGKGTFAVIKKATHNQTGYQVALKTYQKKLLTKKSQLMAIHREIYILAGLNHPNIMKLFEVIDTPTHVNLIMQLCSGPNLLDFQKKHGEKVKFANNKIWTHILSEERVKPIFKQLANAIDYMHKLGLVHRDLRIENIIINDTTNEVKFIDFGFATSFQANKQLQMIGGTPQIKDPKVIKSKTLQCQLADVYSMGIILYILLTGGVPNWALIESDLYLTVQSEKNQLPIREDSLTGQWYEIFSKPLCSLFKKMITCDADNPISMQDILSHPWLANVDNIPTKSVK